MNPPETQSGPRPSQKYFDPEAPDTSEQEFSASLDASGERPKFELDSSVDLSGDGGDEEQLVSGSSTARARSESDRSDHALTNGTVSVPQPEAPPASEWRDLVSAKVKHYKSRKPRAERYPSLQLQFEPPASRQDTTRSDMAKRASRVNHFDAGTTTSQPKIPKIYDTEPRVSLEAAARVLEFPRLAEPPILRDELAEAVVDRPRILEAPELLPPPPALGGILIEPVRQPEPERRPGIDLPLETAPFSRRVMAGLIDLVLIMFALVAFGYVFVRMDGTIPPLRTAGELAGTLLAVLSAAYEYAFTVYCGTTPGIRVTRLRIARFDGTAVPRDVRRWRVLASLLSCVSLGLGYAWCFFDEDQISWHDRITKTHLAPQS